MGSESTHGEGFSRIEKDFLGNERMVHYDADGNITGASELVRESDGSFKVGVPISVDHAHAGEQSVVPPNNTEQPSPVAASPSLDQIPVKQSSGTLLTYGIAAFVVTALLALLFVNLTGNREENRSIPEPASASIASPNDPVIPDTSEQSSPRSEEERPQREPIMEDRRPENPSESRTTVDPDQLRPEPQSDPTPKTESKKPEPTEPKSGSDPVDLRGDDGGVVPPPDNSTPNEPEDIR
jgi:hypothetical protein